MKKSFVKTVMLLSIILVAFSVSACNAEQPLELLSIVYEVSSGGHIKGNETQNVSSGQDALQVTAVPFEGYKFVMWSDNNSTEAIRIDQDVIKNIEATALFEKVKLQVEYGTNVEYRVINGNGRDIYKGRIDGEMKQTIEYRQNASQVIAIPNAGYFFVEWSDGLTTPTRHDLDITKDIDLTAIFALTSQTFIYEFNSAIANNAEQGIILSFNKLNQANYAVPEKEGFKFAGWFLESEFKNKVCSAQGINLADNDIFKKYTSIKDAPVLYAKWIEEYVTVYPVLMIFVTGAKATLTKTDGTPIDVDYKMSDIERKICKLFSPQLSKRLNQTFAGKVVFEVDTYFTSEVVEQDSFRRGADGNGKITYSLMANDIPEIGKVDRYYRSIITNFGFNDLDHMIIEGGGCAGTKYASCYLETIFHSNLMHEESYETTYEKLLNENYSEWEAHMGHYLHEFVHTVELYYSEGEIHAYHKTPNEIGITELYLLHELEVDGKTVGIPSEFWTGDLDITAEYTVHKPYAYNEGGTIEGAGVDVNNGWKKKQTVRYGSDGGEVTAVPREGYRFVKWSDGVTTATRQDKNITSYLTVRAIFEKI